MPVKARKLTAGLLDLWTMMEQPIVPTKYRTRTNR